MNDEIAGPVRGRSRIEEGLSHLGHGLTLALVVMASAKAQAPAPPAHPAPHPSYVVIVQAVHVDRPAGAVWKSVGGFCDLGAWLKISCVYTSGSGGVGTVRLIAGRINEVMVAKTSTSYTYAQPLVPNLYHGTVEIVPDGAGSKIVYSLFYDDSDLPDQAAKEADHAKRAKIFQTALKAMKTISETR